MFIFYLLSNYQTDCNSDEAEIGLSRDSVIMLRMKQYYFVIQGLNVTSYEF